MVVDLDSVLDGGSSALTDVPAILLVSSSFSVFFLFSYGLGAASSGEVSKALSKVTQSDETKKILKKLGMPDIEAAAKPTDCLSKALGSVVRRLKRLAEIKTEVIEAPNASTEISQKFFGCIGCVLGLISLDRSVVFI